MALLDHFQIDGFSVQMEPAITKYGFDDLGDNPTLHRWRAFWAFSDVIGVTGGIELRAYPVIKCNPASVWINADGYRQATKQPWEDGAPANEWVSFQPWMRRKLCHNGAGAAWAKPTQEDAINSLAVRLVRWSNHLRAETDRARSAIDVLEKLRPDLGGYSETANHNLGGK